MSGDICHLTVAYRKWYRARLHEAEARDDDFDSRAQIRAVRILEFHAQPKAARYEIVVEMQGPFYSDLQGIPQTWER